MIFKLLILQAALSVTTLTLEGSILHYATTPEEGTIPVSLPHASPFDILKHFL